jgi:hypothetical protein
VSTTESNLNIYSCLEINADSAKLFEVHVDDYKLTRQNIFDLLYGKCITDDVRKLIIPLFVIFKI